MKKILFIFTFLLLIFGVKMEAYGQEMVVPINVKVNNNYIKMDQKPYIANGTTFVPIRFVSEALAVENIEWDHANQRAIIASKGTEIHLTVGENYGVVNGKKIYINSEITNINGRVFVPLRLVSEGLGCEVYWEQETYTAVIEDNDVIVPASAVIQRSYTDDEILWLARIVEAEAEGEPFQGKLGVANVILNRRDHYDFPDTIYGVIFDKNYGIQFQPVANGAIYNDPSSYSIIAAKMALEGYNNVGQSKYFLNPRKSTNYWIINNKDYFTTIHLHDFYI